MSRISTSIPKGTRDFLPEEIMQRNYIFGVIRIAFERFGFVPIETPSMENLSTLVGKYGEEGDKLLFKILNSGNFTQNVDFSACNPHQLAMQLCEKGLRYDLTVPFARFVVQHQNELTFPFKRYQIQPVWRADKPQKGRYREFYQCDADIIGSHSLLNEWELIQLMDHVFENLQMNVCLHMNNRKILAGIAEVIHCQDKLMDITVSIDKLEKIGLEKVNEELAQRGVDLQSIAQLQPILALEGNFAEKLQQLREILKDSSIGNQGVDEMQILLSRMQIPEIAPCMEVVLDVTLARGLNYYTGTIFEVVSKEVSIGSITGGGRYDNLTDMFGLPNMSGVGISFGIERIFDIYRQVHTDHTAITWNITRVLFVNFGAQETLYCLKALHLLRCEGVNAEMYPDHVKMQKQLKYADNKHIPFVVLAGEEEMRQNMFTLKNMQTGTQWKVTKEELVQKVKE
jgi:histidyl-tRNA synthetase